MKSYINVICPKGSILPSAFYYERKKYPIEKYVSDSFIDGVSVHNVLINGKETAIYHEEIPRVRRWYVLSKAA